VTESDLLGAWAEKKRTPQDSGRSSVKSQWLRSKMVTDDVNKESSAEMLREGIH